VFVSTVQQTKLLQQIEAAVLLALVAKPSKVAYASQQSVH
jgi:hypothetical protein